MVRRDEPEPMRTNDLRMVQVGTALWALGFLVLLPTGRREWLATCAWGFGLGFVGMYVTARRQRRSR